MIPTDVLIVRALSHLERAQLELTLEWPNSAAEFVEKGVDLLREVLER